MPCIWDLNGGDFEAGTALSYSVMTGGGGRKNEKLGHYYYYIRNMKERNENDL